MSECIVDDRKKLEILYYNNLAILHLQDRYEEVGFQCFYNAMTKSYKIIHDNQVTDCEIQECICQLSLAILSLQYKIINQIATLIEKVDHKLSNDNNQQLEEIIYEAKQILLKGHYYDYVNVYQKLLNLRY